MSIKITPIENSSYSWNLSEGELFYDKASSCFYLKKEDDHFKKIREVISSVPLEKINSVQREYFHCVSPRLVQLSDGSYKLYLNLGLLGGMLSLTQKAKSRALGINDLNRSNSEIESAIISNLPDSTYDCVTVSTVYNHKFASDPDEKAKTVRIIQIDLGVVNKFWSFFRSLASAVGILDNLQATTDKYRKAIGGSSIQDAILGLGSSAENAAIQNAFTRATSYTITIDTDLEFIEIRPAASNLMIGYHFLKGIRYYTRDKW